MQVRQAWYFTVGNNAVLNSWSDYVNLLLCCFDVNAYVILCISWFLKIKKNLEKY